MSFSGISRLLPALFALLLLSACARYTELPAGTVLDVTSSAIVEQQDVTIEPPETMAAEADAEYRVGRGDVLAINIPGLVERIAEKGDIQTGFRVYASGKVLLPLVGGVEVAGLTVEEVQVKLTEIFTTYIRKPVVTVEILEYKSQPIYLLGKFNQPGVYYLDRTTSLIHGLAMGKGVQDKANLRGARLVRDERILPVDIYELLNRNSRQQNILLQPGDTVYIPGEEEQKIFVFGSVRKSGPIHMPNGQLNILQALSTAGLEGGDYDQQHIRIIRSLSPTRGQLIVADLDGVMNGKALPFSLANGDIVYVPKSKVGTWNQALQDILPTLQAISATLQPFVQIKFLTDND